jgi:hypothetical protein
MQLGVVAVARSRGVFLDLDLALSQALVPLKPITALFRVPAGMTEEMEAGPPMMAKELPGVQVS